MNEGSRSTSSSSLLNNKFGGTQIPAQHNTGFPNPPASNVNNISPPFVTTSNPQLNMHRPTYTNFIAQSNTAHPNTTQQVKPNQPISTLQTSTPFQTGVKYGIESKSNIIEDNLNKKGLGISNPTWPSVKDSNQKQPLEAHIASPMIISLGSYNFIEYNIFNRCTKYKRYNSK